MLAWGRLAACAAIILSASARAADFGPPGSVGERFNIVAKAAKSDTRLVLRECGPGQASCLYNGLGKISVLVTADAKTPKQTQLIAILIDQSGDPKQFVSIIMLSMLTFSPTTDLEQIRTAFKVMTRSPVEDYREAQVGDVKYVMKKMSPGVIAFTLKDASL